MKNDYVNDDVNDYVNDYVNDHVSLRFSTCFLRAPARQKGLKDSFFRRQRTNSRFKQQSN